MNEYITDVSTIKDLLSENRNSYSAYAGYFCSYFPTELLYGFNIHPVRIQGYSKKRLQRRDLINYICSYLADIIDGFESGHFSWAENLIVPATCDSLYGAGEYLENKIEGLDVKMFRTPLKFDEVNYRFYRSSVEDVLEWMGRRYEFDDAALRRGVEMKNRMNTAVIELLSVEEVLFKGAAYLKLMMAKNILPYDFFMKLIRSVGQGLKEQNFSRKRGNVLMLGPVCDNLGLIDHINAEYNVFTGLLQSSAGVCESEISLDGDLKENIVRYYFDKIGTVTSYDHLNVLIKKLDREVKEHSIRGIVYLNYKFCEPHMFISKQLKDYLEESGLKFLYLEVEHSEGMDALTQNKIDMFLETI